MKRSQTISPPSFNDSVVVPTSYVVLLHGLFGNLSNWEKTRDKLSKTHKVFIPQLPLFENANRFGALEELVIFLERYFDEHQISNPVLIGNSLGGHLALLYALKHPFKVSKLVLTGSSGLYERSFGGSFPRIKDYGYIQEQVASIFEKKDAVDNGMVDYVYDIVQHGSKTLSVIYFARAAQRENLKTLLPQIVIPTLLIWGRQDKVTPPEVGKEFEALLPNAKLHFIDDCGHVPMMEHPEVFNSLVKDFLKGGVHGN